jgi:mRNA interferase HigB
MRIIARRTLREFAESLVGRKDQKVVRGALDGWFAEVRRADWRISADVRKYDARASIVSADRIVFDIKGGGYRLITSIDFEKKHRLDQVDRNSQGLRADRRT